MSDKTQRIRDRAYQLWQEQGEPEGLDADHWLQAEQECAEEEGTAIEGEGSQVGVREYNEGAKAIDDPVSARELKMAEEAGRGHSTTKTRS